MLEPLLEEAQLGAKPGMALVLVGVHRSAEHDHRVGRLVGDALAGDVALDELVPGRANRVLEDARTDVVAVREREYLHPREPTEPGALAPGSSSR